MYPLWRLVSVLLIAASCSRAPELKQYELTGQVLSVESERKQVTVKHDDIKGFMPAMTMPYSVKDASVLQGIQGGDLIRATLMVGEVESYLSAMTKTGHAKLEEAPPPVDQPKILADGEEVPDALLVDQEGAPRPFSSFRGHRLAVTFIYTRCPLPNFCPMMNRHFAAVQETIKRTPRLSDVRLLTVTLDPQFDTPAVLKRHADGVGADRKVWSFMTGAPDEIRKFARAFGIHVEPDTDDANQIIHNLRTAVVDARGRLVAARSGSDWTPASLVADLEAAPPAAR